MNSFKKYPKLSLLFILRTILILVFIYSNYYYRTSIEKQVDEISTLNKGDTELSRINFSSKFREIKEKINTNIDYLFYSQLIIILLLVYIKNKTDIENKRLDEIKS